MVRSLKGVTWHLRLPADRLIELKGEESFHQILALGRLLNSLRFLQFAFLGIPADRDPSIRWFRFKRWVAGMLRRLLPWLLKDKRERPAAMRQRMSAIFYIAAALFEGMGLLQRMAKDFRHYTAWQQHVAPILRDRLIERLFAKSLEPLRNGTVYHFFQDVFDAPLQQLPDENVVFMSGYGSEQGQVFYELSDLLAMSLFIGDVPTTEAQVKRGETLMSRTRDFLIDVEKAGEALIAEYVDKQGFVPVPRAPGSGAS